MNTKQDNLKFWIYEAKRTTEFRKNCKLNKLSISEIRKEIDDDNILITEDKCPNETPRIGKKYQVQIND